VQPLGEARDCKLEILAESGALLKKRAGGGLGYLLFSAART
jgi:hypothetical protein